MVSGSIYIDPDGVSSVSSQMLRTADELDALRRSIVPKVYDVITMSYPLVNELPDTGYSLGSAQDSIGSFDYCATALAEQIRTAGYVLNQVADEGRVMMQELLHQATLFTAPGQGSSSSSNTGSGSTDGTRGFWQRIADYAGTFLGTGDAIIAQFEENVSLFKKLAPWLDSGPGEGLFFGLGVLLDYASGGESGHDYSLRAFVTDLLGGGVGTVVGLTPWGRGAIIVSGAIHLGGTALSWEQEQIAASYGGTTGQQLRDPADGLKTASENANIGAVFDDFGRLILDTNGAGVPELAPGITMLNTVAGAFGVTVSRLGDVPSDLGQTAIDSGKLLVSVPQFAANYGAMQADDTLAAGNQVVQNLPLPSWAKSLSNTATDHTITAINDVADFVTKPDDIKNAWNWATGWIP